MKLGLKVSADQSTDVYKYDAYYSTYVVLTVGYYEAEHGRVAHGPINPPHLSTLCKNCNLPPLFKTQ